MQSSLGGGPGSVISGRTNGVSSERPT